MLGSIPALSDKQDPVTGDCNSSSAMARIGKMRERVPMADIIYAKSAFVNRRFTFQRTVEHPLPAEFARQIAPDGLLPRRAYDANRRPPPAHFSVQCGAVERWRGSAG